MELLLLKVHQFGKELFIPFTLSIFRECLSFCVYAFFPFGFLGSDVGFDCNYASLLPFYLLNCKYRGKNYVI